MRLLWKLFYKLHYQVYLRSPGWEKTKEKYKLDFCQECGAKENLQLHHLNYDGVPKPNWYAIFHPQKAYRMKKYNEVDHKSWFETLCDKHHRMRG